LTLRELEIAKDFPLSTGLLPLKQLTTTERNLFAWLDGFRPEGTTIQNNDGCYELMFRVWQEMHELPWAGDIIYW
jgi:hypothetical protein